MASLFSMPITDFSERTERTERLLGLLRSRERWTGEELAQELDVSLRTIRRELAMLTARGIPIECERGRGGGVRLSGPMGVTRLQLEYREVLDLLLALAVSESLRSPLLLSSVRGVRQKLSKVFASEERRKINALRKRILVGSTASAAVVSTLEAPKQNVVRVVQDAFFAQCVVEVEYENERKERTTRSIEPQCFLLNWPAWYLLVWDRLRSAGRTLRLDRVLSARKIDEHFALREPASLSEEARTFFQSV